MRKSGHYFCPIYFWVYASTWHADFSRDRCDGDFEIGNFIEILI